jgi:hypothetical protein
MRNHEKKAVKQPKTHAKKGGHMKKSVQQPKTHAKKGEQGKKRAKQWGLLRIMKLLERMTRLFRSMKRLVSTLISVIILLQILVSVINDPHTRQGPEGHRHFLPGRHI